MLWSDESQQTWDSSSFAEKRRGKWLPGGWAGAEASRGRLWSRRLQHTVWRETQALSLWQAIDTPAEMRAVVSACQRPQGCMARGMRQEGRGRGEPNAGWGNERSCPVFESRESSAVLLPNIHPITHSGSTILIVLWGPSPTLHPCNPGELAPVSASQYEHATQASRIRAKPEIYDGSIRKYTFCFYSACYVGRLYACWQPALVFCAAAGGGLVSQSCPTLVTAWIVACQVPLSMGFSMQEYWSGLPVPPPEDLPNAGIEP